MGKRRDFLLSLPRRTEPTNRPLEYPHRYPGSLAPFWKRRARAYSFKFNPVFLSLSGRSNHLKAGEPLLSNWKFKSDQLSDLLPTETPLLITQSSAAVNEQPWSYKNIPMKHWGGAFPKKVLSHLAFLNSVWQDFSFPNTFFIAMELVDRHSTGEIIKPHNAVYREVLLQIDLNRSPRCFK